MHGSCSALLRMQVEGLGFRRMFRQDVTTDLTHSGSWKAEHHLDEGKEAFGGNESLELDNCQPATTQRHPSKNGGRATLSCLDTRPLEQGTACTAS